MATKNILLSQFDLPWAIKFAIPTLRPNVVRRLRLMPPFLDMLRYKLVLVAAPAGYGKTTLLSQWANESPIQTAWLSLDSRDNDPLRFWAHLIGALQTIYPQAGGRALKLIHSLQVPRAEIIAETLADDLAAQPEPVALVLDDYHVIEARSIHDAINFLLDHETPNLHLVIATRKDLPFSLSKLRAGASLLEIRTSDLRFTTEEAGLFLEQTVGLQLTADQVSVLTYRVEGWIAGLQLAALSLQKSETPAAFFDAFKSGHRLIFDYLADEVLKDQPAEIQAFLMKTSIVDRINASLGDALTGSQDGARLLEKVEQSNLFITPINGKGGWYRYHEFFADLLRIRLEQFDKASVPLLHQQASRWYEQEGLMEEAVRHALIARKYETAARLINKTLKELLARSEVHKVLDWSNLLPEEFIRSDPAVCLLFASALALSGRFGQAENLLEIIETSLSGQAASTRGEEEIMAWVGIFRAFMMRFRDSRQAVSLSRQALERASKEEPGIRARALLCLGHAQLLVGNSVAADQALSEATAVFRDQGQIPACLSAIDYQAQIRILQGRLREARILYLDALRGIKEEGPVFSGIDQIGIGKLLYETNNLADAGHFLEKGIELAEQGGDFVFVIDGYAARSHWEQANGNFEEALYLLQRVQELLSQGQMTSALVPIEALKARLWLRQENLAAARQWAQTFNSSAEDALSYVNIIAFSTFVQILIAEREYGNALALLKRLIQEAETLGWKGIVIEFLALRSLALDARGDKKPALESLDEALSLARPEHYVRTFIDLGRPMAELLQRYRNAQKRDPIGRSRSPSFKYINELLNAFSASAVRRPGDDRSAGGNKLKIESLTPREKEILKLVAEGLSNRDIAKEAIISEGTVRRHMHNINNKLGARNRTEAVARARNLDLI